METLQLLPDNILRRQVCQECFQYLSVAPITVNNRGETICGRCFNSTESNLEARKYIKSFFNIAAERFSFRCTNHLNGCTQILGFSETINHEETCVYAKQQCFFCSFSGNVSQILNHSLKFHPKNVALDGKIAFCLNDKLFHKSVVLIPKNNQLLHVVFDVTDESFTALISPVKIKTSLPTVNQYGIRFFRSDNPENVHYIHTDYGLLNDSMQTYFKKNKEELVSFFGLEVTLNCEILIEQFSLGVKEFEIRQRSAKLRQSEDQLNNFRRELQAEAQKLSQQNDSYNFAINLIKRISCDLFKCLSCKKIICDEVYFCPKNHCCCKSCLTKVCITCKSVQEFNRLKDIEKFSISCDWPGCEKTTFLKDYLKHKSVCLHRPYKCPLLNCYKVILSSQKLIEHWHCVVPTLTGERTIMCEENMFMEYYWFVENDLYQVFINFNYSTILVLINEVNVLPNNISFTCKGFVNSDWKRLASSTLSGKFQVNIPNSVSIVLTTKRVYNPELKEYQEQTIKNTLTQARYTSLRISYN